MLGTIRKVWLVVWVVILVLLISLTVWLKWPFAPTDWLVPIPAVLLLAGHLYRNWPWFYLQVHRLWLSATNVTTHWSLDVALQPSDQTISPAALSTLLEDSLVRHYANVVRISRHSAFAFDLAIERQFCANVCIEDNEDLSVVSIQILDMAVGFRDSMRRIKDQICPFIERIEEQFAQNVEAKTYGLVAHFDGDNPYFGLFIHKLKLSTVATFNLTIKSNTPGKVLHVTRDGVSLTTRSLQTFRTEAEQVFCLTAGEA